MPRKKIRVLIVDDSFFVRKVLKKMLNSDARIEVVGQARNGVVALEQAKKLLPDVITMDYNMPRADGLEATENILSTVRPKPKIIMVSAYTTEAAEITFKCLRAGAVDFIAKTDGEMSTNLSSLEKELISKIKTAAIASVHQYTKITPLKIKPISTKAGRQPNIIVIGSSTGGPPTLEKILVSLPSNLPATILVAQHIPPGFSTSMAKRLDVLCQLTIKEASHREELETSTCYVAPGGYHSTIKSLSSKEKKYISLSHKNAGFGVLQPSIDIAMSSAVEQFGSRVIGVILTGMGNDGTKGMLDIKKAEGHTIAQKPDTAVVDSMPNSVIQADLADEILSPTQIAKRITQLVSSS